MLAEGDAGAAAAAAAAARAWHEENSEALRRGQTVRCSAVDDIMPSCYVRVLLAYPTSNIVASPALWHRTAAAAALRASLLQVVHRHLPHLSCARGRSRRTGHLCVRGPPGRCDPPVSLSVMQGWVPPRREMADGVTGGWPIAELDRAGPEGRPSGMEVEVEEDWIPSDPALRASITYCYRSDRSSSGSFSGDGDGDGDGSPSPENSCKDAAALVMVLCFHHELFDAASICSFLQLWSAVHNEATAAAAAASKTDAIEGSARVWWAPQLLQPDRTPVTHLYSPPAAALPDGGGDNSFVRFPSGLQFFSNEELTTSPVRGCVRDKVVARFRFDLSTIAALQQQAVTDKGAAPVRLSKNDVLVAMLWKALYCGAEAAGLEEMYRGARAGTHNAAVLVPINMRGKMPGVDVAFFGNAVSLMAVALPLASLRALPLLDVAAEVHRQVRRAASPASIAYQLHWCSDDGDNGCGGLAKCGAGDDDAAAAAALVRERWLAMRRHGGGGGMFLPSLESASLSSWARYPIHQVAAFCLGGVDERASPPEAPALATEIHDFKIPSLGAFMPATQRREEGDSSSSSSSSPSLAAATHVDAVVCVGGRAHIDGILQCLDFHGKLLGILL